MSATRVRDRAKIVCVQCHARKVKCDLQDQSSGRCSHCRRLGHTCQRRGVSRVTTGYDGSAFVALSSPAPSTSFSQPNSATTPAQAFFATPQSRESEGAFTLPDQSGFVGEESLMFNASPNMSIPIRKPGTFSENINEELLKITGATVLPPPAMVEALADSYFRFMYHRCPVVDRQDLLVERPSVLLLQALCLVGAILRHPKDSSPLSTSEEFYVKCKTLLYTDHEKDSLATVKAICLMTFWNVTPPLVVTLDCSWHWLGVITRHIFQMGLHRESTYSKLPRPGNARRIAWYAFTVDKLQAACYGRPAVLKSYEFDVKHPTLGDFETADDQAGCFIELTKLALIFGRMLETRYRQPENSADEAISILASLKDWINKIPAKLRLYDGSGRRVYRRDVYEVHITYFVGVIVFFHLCGHKIRTSASPIASLIASSCLTRLYQEMDFRDDVNYLMPINNWFLMTGCVPQLYYETGSYDGDKICTEELDILIRVLKQMLTKWPPTSLLINTVERLRRTKSGSLNTANATPERDSMPKYRQAGTDMLQGLFPFPRSMCPRMSLVDQNGGQSRDELITSMTLPNDEDLDWIFNELNVDIFDMDFNVLPTQLNALESGYI